MSDLEKAAAERTEAFATRVESSLPATVERDEGPAPRGVYVTRPGIGDQCGGAVSFTAEEIRSVGAPRKTYGRDTQNTHFDVELKNRQCYELLPKYHEEVLGLFLRSR